MSWVVKQWGNKVVAPLERHHIKKETRFSALTYTLAGLIYMLLFALRGERFMAAVVGARLSHIICLLNSGTEHVVFVAALMPRAEGVWQQEEAAERLFAHLTDEMEFVAEDVLSDEVTKWWVDGNYSIVSPWWGYDHDD